MCRGCALRPPRIPYVSNVTGTWITGREATDAEYWARHLCRAGRFASGGGELLRGPSRLLLEVGPGQALSTAARQHPESGGAVVVPSLGERVGADQATILRGGGWVLFLGGGLHSGGVER